MGKGRRGVLLGAVGLVLVGMDGRPRVPKHLVEHGCMTKEARFHRLVHEEQPYSFFYQRYRTVLYRAPLNASDFSLDWSYADPRYWSFQRLPLSC